MSNSYKTAGDVDQEDHGLFARRQWSPAKFKVLANFLMKEYARNGVNVEELVRAQIAKAKNNGRTISYDTAYEEVIADSMETMLSDGNVLEKLAKLKQADKSLWQKIKSFISELAAKIRKVYGGLSPDSVEGRLVAEMADSIEKLQSLFAEGLVEASENAKAAGVEKNTAQEGDAVKFCLRDGASNEFNPEGMTLESQLGDILKTAQSFDGRYLYIGKFTSEFRKMVSQYIEIKDLPVVMNYRDAYLAMESKENGRYQGDGVNYHNLGVDGMVDAINSFDTPDAVMASKREGKIELVLQGVDRKGNKLLSIVALNTTAQNARKFIEAHIVTSIYGRRSIENYIKKAETEGRLIYNKNEESAQGIPQVQYEGDINANSSKLSIRNPEADVKEKLSLREPEAGVKYSIREGMTEQERFEELKNKNIAVVSNSRTAEYADEIASLEALQTRAKSKAEKIIRPLAKKLGIINTPLATTDVEIDFLFTASGGLAESMHKQLRYGGSYVDFAKTLINLDHVLESAVLIEVHGDKYAGSSRANTNLEAVYVLFGAFEDSGKIIPVQMEIKKTSDAGGRLYLTVAMTKIEADVVGSAPGKLQAPSLIPASNRSLAEIFSKINPQDGHFLKYLPDGFLSDEQIKAKNAALEEDKSRIAGYSLRDPEVEKAAEALLEASENAKAAGAEKNTAQEGDVKYSLRAFEKDGRRFVEIDQEQDRFDGHSDDEYPGIAKEIIKEKFENKVVGIDNKMFVNGAGRSEYAYPSKPITDASIYEAKMRASPELDNLLDAGTNFRNEADGRDGHIHPDAIGGFDYFDTLFKIGNRYFEGRINIKNVKRGKLFTDVTQIKDVTQAIMSSYGNNPKSQFLRTSSMNSIRNPEADVKEKLSLRDPEVEVKYSDRLELSPSEYNRLTKKKPIKVSSQERAMIRAQRKTKYGGLGEYDIPIIDFFRIGDYRIVNNGFIYYIRNSGPDDFSVVMRKQIVPDTRRITREVIEDENRSNDAATDPRAGQEEGKRGSDRGSSERTGNRRELHENDQGTVQPGESQRDLHTGQGNADSGTVKLSDRDTDSVSNRSLLANALEGASKNDIERNKIQEYKGKISLINAEEKKLRELNEQIKELSFAKGPRDKDKISKLRDEATKTANRIGIYDKQLLRLEVSAPLQRVLDREKKKAYQRAQQRGREALEAYREKAAESQREITERYRESRKRAAEGRDRTAMRHKIRNVVNELNQYLLKGTKERHVPIELQKAVAEALDAVNMDTVGAEERIARLEQELLKAKTPEKIQEISRKIDRVREMGGRMHDRLTKLRDAYEQFVNSDDPLIANSHDEVISNKLQAVIEAVGDTPLRDMTLSQLAEVHDMYRMVLTTIRNANKAFKAKKNESISEIAGRVMMEVMEAGGKKKKGLAMLNGIKGFSWDNLKPVYAFRHIGSDAFTEIFENVRAGEDVWAVDVTEAREFYLEKSRKYGYDGWDFQKEHSFTATSGMEFSLGLEQIMSLYAYSKRDQAAEHLKRGGIVFDSSITVRDEFKLGFIKVGAKVEMTDATAYNLSDETLAEIVSKLTDEQKAFVDEMQEYLSTVMGGKGNEVSLAMYGIKLFKEKFYFPLKSATQFMAKAKEQQQGEAKIKNKGFSKETVRKASNPIVLTPFMNVWAEHVNEMSMYHAFVLPMEDFYRVYNFKTATSETNATESVEMYIQNAYGKGATRYIDQLLRDLNGGARTDHTTGFINKATGLFKKGAVFASLSVVIQQPSAIARATALVDTKYFIGPKVDHQRHKALWNEVKRYAPVAIIKEMGYFDTNMGKSTQDFITAREYSGFAEKMTALVTDSGYRDEVFSKAPALADEIAWCGIWEAVKRETRAKHPDMDVRSEKFLQLVGKRFTEVIVKTQVYDSVLSRSGLMRSKDTGMKTATAFMAEPTTSINMIADALLQGKRGNRKYRGAAIGAVIASLILNSILVAFVYAMRDDDEDESYVEKYIGSLTGALLDNLDPTRYIPFIKDIASIAHGYDVERSDMAVFSDLWNGIQSLGKENVPVYRKVEDFAGSIGQMFGLPVKNIMRDARAMYQTVMSFVEGEPTTAAGIGYAVKSATPKWLGGGDVPNTKQLYDAYVSGDSKQIDRVVSRFKDQAAVTAAIRKALREQDPRIREAAEAKASGDMNGYLQIAREIIAEKHFSQDNVVAAINAEVNAMTKEESTASAQKAIGYFKAEDFALAIAQGDAAMAQTVRNDMIQTARKNGKTTAEAEKSFISTATSACKDMFDAGELTENQAEDALVNFCGKTEGEAFSKVQYWAFKQEYPDVYVDDTWIDEYYAEVADSGMGIDDFVEYRNRVKGITGENKKERRMAVIHSLPISRKQKDALYYAEGWAESRIGEAPWH